MIASDLTDRERFKHQIAAVKILLVAVKRHLLTSLNRLVSKKVLLAFDSDVNPWIVSRLRFI